MSVFIHHTELACALGVNIEQCIKNLSLLNANPISHTIEHLRELVSFPYFTVNREKLNENAHLRTTEILSQQIETILNKHSLTKKDLKKTGLFVASSSHAIDASEHIYRQSLISNPRDSFPLASIGYSNLAETIREQYQLGPHSYTISSACSSASNALIFAHKMIETQQIDHAIVVGYEMFNEITALGFLGLELISTSGRLRPFDSRRDGMVLGEGCASLFLSKEVQSDEIMLMGGATNTDPSSLTAANEDGSTIAKVMTLAMSQACIPTEEIRAIKIHGTASLLYDEAESKAILSTFTAPPPLFALKPYIGHTLGASAAIETILATSLLKQGIIPGNQGIGVDQSELGISLNQSNMAAADGSYLLNFFAFGGNNSSIILRK